jgi:transcriptional regulator with XRE-family HTH domain
MCDPEGGTVQQCATLRTMNRKPVEFGQQVYERRTELGLSISKAARRAGLSDTGWGKIERAANVEGPERISILKIARVLGWDPDEALAKAGEGPSTGPERSAAPINPKTERDRLWPSLTEPQKWAVIGLMATMVTPRQWPEFGGTTPRSQQPQPSDSGGDAVRVIDLGDEHDLDELDRREREERDNSNG